MVVQVVHEKFPHAWVGGFGDLKKIMRVSALYQDSDFGSHGSVLPKSCEGLCGQFAGPEDRPKLGRGTK